MRTGKAGIIVVRRLKHKELPLSINLAWWIVRIDLIVRAQIKWLHHDCLLLIEIEIVLRRVGYFNVLRSSKHRRKRCDVHVPVLSLRLVLVGHDLRIFHIVYIPMLILFLMRHACIFHIIILIIILMNRDEHGLMDWESALSLILLELIRRQYKVNAWLPWACVSRSNELICILGWSFIWQVYSHPCYNSCSFGRCLIDYLDGFAGHVDAHHWANIFNGFIMLVIAFKFFGILSGLKILDLLSLVKIDLGSRGNSLSPTSSFLKLVPAPFVDLLLSET
jgi:hypothetical protein